MTASLFRIAVQDMHAMLAEQRRMNGVILKHTMDSNLASARHRAMKAAADKMGQT